MSKLIENSITIYEALQNIKNGKYVMPAFQRQFVWTCAFNRSSSEPGMYIMSNVDQYTGGCWSVAVFLRDALARRSSACVVPQDSVVFVWGNS